MTMPYGSPPQQQPSPVPRGTGLRVLVAVLAVALVGSIAVNVWQWTSGRDSATGAAVTTSGEATPESSSETPAPEVAEIVMADTGFATQDEVMAYVVSSLAEGEWFAAAGTCAPRAKAENIDFEKTVEHLKSWMPQLGYSPDQFPYWEQANQAQAAGQCLDEFTRLAWALVVDPETVSLSAVRVVDEDIAGFVAEFDPAALSGLAIVDTEPLTVTNENPKQNLDNMCARFGAQECSTALVLLQAGDRMLPVGPTFVKYGDLWYLGTLNGFAGALAGISVVQPEPVTEQEFTEMAEQAQEVAGS